MKAGSYFDIVVIDTYLQRYPEYQRMGMDNSPILRYIIGIYRDDIQWVSLLKHCLWLSSNKYGISQYTGTTQRILKVYYA